MRRERRKFFKIYTYYSLRYDSRSVDSSETYRGSTAKTGIQRVTHDIGHEAAFQNISHLYFIERYPSRSDLVAPACDPNENAPSHPDPRPRSVRYHPSRLPYISRDENIILFRVERLAARRRPDQMMHRFSYKNRIVLSTNFSNQMPVVHAHVPEARLVTYFFFNINFTRRIIRKKNHCPLNRSDEKRTGPHLALDLILPLLRRAPKPMHRKKNPSPHTILER